MDIFAFSEEYCREKDMEELNEGQEVPAGGRIVAPDPAAPDAVEAALARAKEVLARWEDSRAAYETEPPGGEISDALAGLVAALEG